MTACDSWWWTLTCMLFHISYIGMSPVHVCRWCGAACWLDWQACHTACRQTRACLSQGCAVRRNTRRPGYDTCFATLMPWASYRQSAQRWPPDKTKHTNLAAAIQCGRARVRIRHPVVWADASPCDACEDSRTTDTAHHKHRTCISCQCEPHACVGWSDVSAWCAGCICGTCTHLTCRYWTRAHQATTAKNNQQSVHHLITFNHTIKWNWMELSWCTAFTSCPSTW